MIRSERAMLNLKSRSDYGLRPPKIVSHSSKTKTKQDSSMIAWHWRRKTTTWQATSSGTKCCNETFPKKININLSDKKVKPLRLWSHIKVQPWLPQEIERELAKGRRIGAGRSIHYVEDVGLGEAFQRVMSLSSGINPVCSTLAVPLHLGASCSSVCVCVSDWGR